MPKGSGVTSKEPGLSEIEEDGAGGRKKEEESLVYNIKLSLPGVPVPVDVMVSFGVTIILTS
jgi:hypothetical protein